MAVAQLHEPAVGRDHRLRMRHDRGDVVLGHRVVDRVGATPPHGLDHEEGASGGRRLEPVPEGPFM